MINYDEESKLLKNYSFIDLFCGIGGFHLALSSLGAKCVFASDINVKAAEVYENNFHIRPKGDITKIKCKDIPKHDILCAGFPCQPFSISGKGAGFEDKVNGKLFYEIVRIVRFHKPKLIILENVKNLENHDNGNTLKVIKTKLDELGYNVFPRVLNASDFGIPQARKRIYIVAFKKKLKIKSFRFPEGTKNFTCLEDVLESEVEKKYFIDRKYEIADKEEKKRSNQLVRIGSIGPGRQGERIYSIKGQATTLSSQGGGPGGKTGIYLIKNKIRILCPRECARLMGFPDNYKLASTDGECYKQFGNSVVVDVIQEIMCEASKLLNKEC